LAAVHQLAQRRTPHRRTNGGFQRGAGISERIPEDRFDHGHPFLRQIYFESVLAVIQPDPHYEILPKPSVSSIKVPHGSLRNALLNFTSTPPCPPSRRSCPSCPSTAIPISCNRLQSESRPATSKPM